MSTVIMLQMTADEFEERVRQAVERVVHSRLDAELAKLRYELDARGATALTDKDIRALSRQGWLTGKAAAEMLGVDYKTLKRNAKGMGLVANALGKYRAEDVQKLRELPFGERPSMKQRSRMERADA